METASHLESDEERALQMAVLYRIDPRKAECVLKAYVEERHSLVPVYKLLSLDFLKKHNLVDGNVIKSLAKINTRRYFVQRRLFFIDQDASSYGMLYSELVHFSAAGRQSASRVLKHALRIVDPLKAIDILSRLVLLPKLPFEYKKMVELFDVLSSHSHKMTPLFVKNAFLLRNDSLSRHVLRKCNYGHTEFSVLAEVDLDFCTRHLKNFCTNKELLRIFLRHVPASEFLTYRQHFDSEMLLSNLDKISLLDAQEHSQLLKDQRIFTDYWSVLSRQKPLSRFLHYEMLGESQNVFGETKRLLKRLSLCNIETIYTKMETLIYESPISYFKATIETIYSYDTLLSVVEKIFFRVPPIFIDILYFCVLRIIVSRYDFVVDGGYLKWYLNLCSLFKIIMPLVQLDATYTILEKFFELRRYAHLPLLETIVHKHMETGGRKTEAQAFAETRRSLELPDALLFHISSAVNDVFLYENHPLELKVDLSERYRKICEALGGRPPCAAGLSLEDMKYLTPCEVEMAARSIDEEHVNKIVSEFKSNYGAGKTYDSSTSTAKHTRELSLQKFFTIKNFILLVNIRHSSVQDIDWLVEYLGGARNLNRSDLRLLGESCLSNILVDVRKNKRHKGKTENTSITPPGTNQCESEDTSKVEKHEPQKSSQEEGEIRE